MNDLHVVMFPKWASIKVKSSGLKLSADHGWFMNALPDMYNA